MFLNRFSAIAVAFLSLTALTAFAADTTATLPSAATSAAAGTSEASTSSSPSQSVMDRMYINFFSNFHGPTVQNLGSPYSLDSKGKVSSRGINFDSDLTVAYMLDPSVGLGLDLPFFYLPGKATAFELGDVGVKVFNKKLLSTPNFSLYGNILVEAITSDYSRSLGQKIGLKTTPNFRYNIPKSRFAVGAWTEAKAYVGAEKGKAFKLWGCPYVNYQLTPKLSAVLEYEIETDHMVNNGGLLNFTTYQSDIMPGISYFITPHVMVNPYLQIFTNDRVAWDRTGLGALVSATL